MDYKANVQQQVKDKYGSAARAVAESGSVQACCDPGLRCCDPITANLYSSGEKGELPVKAVQASLGCGNPTALIELKPDRWCSTSVPVAASTFFFRRGAWVRPARHTAWI